MNFKRSITDAVKKFIGNQLRSQFDAISARLLGGDMAGAVQLIEQAQIRYPEFGTTVEGLKGKSPAEVVEALAAFWPELRETPGAALMIAPLLSQLNQGS